MLLLFWDRNFEQHIKLIADEFGRGYSLPDRATLCSKRHSENVPLYFMWARASRENANLVTVAKLTNSRLPRPSRSSGSDSVGLRSSLSSSKSSSCRNLKFDSLWKILWRFLVYCLAWFPAPLRLRRIFFELSPPLFSGIVFHKAKEIFTSSFLIMTTNELWID